MNTPTAPPRHGVAAPTHRYGKPGKKLPMLELLRAVDKYKPYMAPTGQAKTAAWQRVQKKAYPTKMVDVAARFGMLATMFRNGTCLLGGKGSIEYELLKKLVEDMGRCERPEYSGDATEPLAKEGATPEVAATAEAHEEEAQDEATRDGPPASRLRPKRQRDPEENVDDEKPAPTRPHTQKKPKTTASPVKRKVDATSDDQFVDLLIEYAPHLAPTGGRDAAWQRVGDALPVGNALWGRKPHGLKMRYHWLTRWMVSPSAADRDKLTSALSAKLQGYMDRVEPPACERGEIEVAQAVETPSVCTKDPVARDGSVPVVDREAAALALAAQVERNIHREWSEYEKNMHRERMLREQNMQRMIMKRLDEVALVLKKTVKKVKGKEKETTGVTAPARDETQS